MAVIRYTQWDGSQRIRLDADKVLEKLSEYLSYTDDVRQAMDWLTRQGFDIDGSRVMGLDEFLEELRQEIRQRYRDFNLKSSMSEMEQRLQDILDREREALESEPPAGQIRDAGQAAAAWKSAAKALRGAAQAGQLRVRGRRGGRGFRRAAERVREHPRPGEFQGSLRPDVPRPAEPQLRSGAPVDARDGALKAARTGPDVGELRVDLARRAKGADGPAGECRTFRTCARSSCCSRTPAT